MDNNLTFIDLSLLNSMEHNRSIKRMEKINAIINWSRIENLLLRDYPVGKSAEGADAYPPLLLLKCFLIQQWFHIDSDPELETQINDRISFKKFLGLSFDQPSPDHSTFSRFRNRLRPAKLYKTSNYVIPAGNPGACLGKPACALQGESSIIKYFLDSGSPSIRPALSPK